LANRREIAIILLMVLLLGGVWFVVTRLDTAQSGAQTQFVYDAVRNAALTLLRQGLYHLAASDAHSSDSRTTDLRTTRQQLQQLCPPEYVRVLTQVNPARLLRGEDMLPTE
jgi:tyrosine-protein phosphatase YwqE